MFLSTLAASSGKRLCVGLVSVRLSVCPVRSGKSGPKDQVALYFAFALVHDLRGIEFVNFTISLALSAGTLMASAGTPGRLVPAHFYPCPFIDSR